MANKLTIEELLNSLVNPNTEEGLENTTETWRNIGNKTIFDEVDSSEVEEFLANNDYDNI